MTHHFYLYASISQRSLMQRSDIFIAGAIYTRLVVRVLCINIRVREMALIIWIAIALTERRYHHAVHHDDNFQTNFEQIS